MREKFIDYNFSTESEKIVAQAVTICDTYRRQGYDLSLRQIYYQFVSKDIFPNTEQSYKRLGDIVSNARLAGRLDWDMIKDRGRETTTLPHWSGRRGFLRSVMPQYKIDTWHNQPNHVETVVEKQALEGVLEPVCRRLDIPFTANKGYSSSSAMYEMGKRLQKKFVGQGDIRDYDFEDILFYQKLDELFDYENNDYIPSEAQITELRDSEKPSDWEKALQLLAEEGRAFMKPHPKGGKALHVIYLGDHDPSGIDMTRDVKVRLEQFSRCPVNVHRAALNMDQIRQYNPPPNPTKVSDSRAKEYISQYGMTCWELDALAPNVLASLVTNQVETLLERPLYDMTVGQMLEHRAELVGISDRYVDDDAEAGDEEEDDDA